MRSRMMSHVLLTGMAFFLLASSSLARFDVWEPENGVAIRQGRHVSVVPGSRAPSEDGTHFLQLWSESFTGIMNVRAQLFAFDGTPIWNEDLHLTDDPFPQQEARAVLLDDGAWLIGWVDYRNDLSKDGIGQLYLQKLNSDGSAVWDSPVGPYEDVRSHYVNSSRRTLDILPVSEGRAFLKTERNDTACVQLMNSDGTLAWDQPIRFEASMNSVKMVSDGNDGCLVGWLDDAYGDRSIHITRIVSDGTSPWDEGLSGLEIPNSDGAVSWSLHSLDSGEAVISWYHASNHEILAQKLDEEGELLWGNNGSMISADQINIYDVQLYPLTSGSMLLTWESGYRQISLIKIEPDGSVPVFGFDQGPVVIEDCYTVQAFSLLDENRFVLSTIMRSGDRLEEVVRAYSTQGTLLWETECYNSSETNGLIQEVRQGHALYTSDGTVSYVTQSYLEDMRGTTLIRFNEMTGALLDTAPQPLVVGVTDETQTPTILASGESLITTWRDRRWGDQHYFQIQDMETGTPALEANGRSVFPALAGETGNEFVVDGIFRTVSDGDGGAVLVREEASTQGREGRLRLQRISSSGTLLWGDSGIVPEIELTEETSVGDLRLLEVATLPNGNVFVVFNTFTDQFASRQHYSIFQPDGSMTNDVAFDLPIESGVGAEQLFTALETYDNGDVLLAATNSQFTVGTLDLYLFRISPDGEIVWTVTLDRSFYGSWHVVMLGNEQVIAETLDEEYTSRMFVVSPEGVLSGGEEGIQIPTSSMEHFVNKLIPFEESLGVYFYSINDVNQLLLISPDGSLVREDPILLAEGDHAATWVQDLYGGIYLINYHHGDNNTELTYLHLDQSGYPTHEDYENGSVMLCDAWFDQGYVEAVPDGENGFVAVWNDWRGSLIQRNYDDVYSMRVNDLTTGVAEPTASQPVDYMLLEAYPNPFNATARIHFTVPEAGQVHLSVYDILGRRVTQLMNKRVEAGSHQVVWDATGNGNHSVASGVYFLRLESAGEEMTKRVTLVR